jgi:hypothetical protein
MSDRTQADLDALHAIATRLQQSGDTLDSVGSNAPRVPDAGEVTALMGDLVAHLSESAGNLVVGLRAASARVSQSREAYLRQDQATSEEFRGLF